VKEATEKEFYASVNECKCPTQPTYEKSVWVGESMTILYYCSEHAPKDAEEIRL